MVRSIIVLVLALSGALLIDQAIKSIFLDGFRLYTSCIDLILVYNKGVAFSMFAFLAESLKWIQLALLAGVIGYTLWLKQKCYLIPVGIMVGAGLSNVADRFVHGGVVDFVYWHCGFNFAVFNTADMMIDFAVLWLMILNFKPKMCES
ncbi:MAG: signal peptidase II [Sulfuricurvum sp.]|uniref:signal peptidase II n=1 Tax=Sulfuricurvum sp. TaxID=2025608 RepID=UPI002610538C|nr:signal peptidase II [Sulfuricurvum sp.]MDD2828728.1 signal peptidase II [Sulfuricurvum sp.]MDD4949306.1 signal peptidase II [Sulfuricurvum sp.]